MTQFQDSRSQPVLPYAPSLPCVPRTRVLPMTAACIAGGVGAIFILVAVQGTLHLLILLSNILPLLLNISTIAGGFLPAFYLFRPARHRLHWPPYALAALCGTGVVIAWRTIYWYIVMAIFQFTPRIPTLISMYVVSFAALTLLSFSISLPALFLYRRTVDRSLRTQRAA